MPGARFGVFGLGVMGQNLARNMASHDVPVALYNRTPARTERLIAEHGAEGDFLPAYDLAAFVASIEGPRPVLLMVKAGEAVAEANGDLAPHLGQGDIVIDGGNACFADTPRRRSAAA